MAAEMWAGRFDFIVSSLGLTLGLVGAWRFPYLCYRNGGGAFLIPYVVVNFILGYPMMFFELALGQFSSEGPFAVWKICPLFKGNGLACIATCVMIGIYYTMLIAYSIFYMVVSLVNLDGEVPWGSCDPAWSTDHCRQEAYPDFESMENNTEKVLQAVGLMYPDCVNTTFHDHFFPDFNSIDDLNFTTVRANFTHCEMNLVSPSEEYWTRFVLRLHDSDGIEHMGSVNLKNAFCLLLAWILSFVSLIKGIKSYGKVVYFTALYPYFILVVLFVRGITLPGAYDGILYYIVPDWSRLTHPKVWVDAALQNFFVFGIGLGELVCFSSFNKFNKNCLRDATIIASASGFGGFFAGFPVFALLGSMAHQTNRDIADVTVSGPGLVFVAYTEAIARLPGSSIWAFLTFLMIFCLGMSPHIALVETIVTGFTDIFPGFLRPHKTAVTFVCCTLGFLLGIPQTTKGGIYVFTLLDWHTVSHNVLLIAFFELVAVMWIYGFRKFIQDVEMMIGAKPKMFWSYWVSMWLAVTPVAILFLVAMSAVYYTPVGYGDNYKFPSWAQGVGWTLTGFPVTIIVVGIAVQGIRKGGIRKALTAEDWGPRLSENRQGQHADTGPTPAISTRV